MADYAGAYAAMRARFKANWTETPIAFQNEVPSDDNDVPIDPFPPKDAAGNFAPWVYFEVITTQSEIRGAGLPGNQTWLTRGYIYIYVYTRIGYGYPEVLRMADQAGEIFRSKTFYQDGAGSKILCMAPETDGGNSSSDDGPASALTYDGNWFRVATAIPFEFYFTK